MPAARSQPLPPRNVTVRVATGIVLGTVVGHFSSDQVAPMLKTLDEIVTRDGSIVLFQDWSKMTGYDAEVRTRLTQWTVENRRRVIAVHILVSSPIVKMGVATAGLFLGGGLMHSENDPEAFRLKLEEAKRVARSL
jgi:hypothetical protein